MPREDQLRVLENKAWVKNIDFNKGPILSISTISTTTITTTTRKHFDTIYRKQGLRIRIPNLKKIETGSHLSI